jgi:hypothetical protein
VRLGVAALALLLATPLRAQDGNAKDVITGAVRAYRDLDFEVAARMLRRALTPPLVTGLDDAERAQALTYLGAAEHYRARHDSAIAVFRRLVVFAPRHRPDTLVFPPEITRLYDDVRRRTKVVAIRLPADTEFMLAGEGRLVAWLYPSVPHDVTVAINREDGRRLRTVFTGPIGDSLDVRWDGRDSTGALATGDRLWLTVASRGAGSEATRLVRVPLRVELSGADTLRHTPPLTSNQLLPERADGGTGVRSLAGGLLLAAGALTLPAITAPGERASGTRFVVAGALGVSGLVGYLSRRPGRPLPENAAINRTRRDAWRRQEDVVTRENAQRMRAARLRIRSGTMVVVERGGGDS